MDNNNTPPVHQKLLTQWGPWLLAGFYGLGNFLGLIKDIDYITPLIALGVTIVILIIWGLAEFLPLRWVFSDGPSTIIKRLGNQIRFGLVGMIVLLWTPSIIGWVIEVSSSTRDAESESSGISVVQTKSPTPIVVNEFVLFEEDFEDGKANEFLVKDGDWQVVEDDTGDKVYAVRNTHDLIWVEVKFGSRDWDSYVVEYKAKVIDFDESNKWPVVAFGFREDGENAYRFLFNLPNESLQVVFDEGESWVWVDGTDFSFERGIWYSVRIEADESHFKMYVDDVIKIDTNDSRLINGYSTLIVGPHTTAQFDDIRIISLEETVK